MKYKTLRSIVNSLADMAASEQRMYDSFELILDRSLKQVSIDLIASVKTESNEELPIVQDLQIWFVKELEKQSINLAGIESAKLEVSFDYTKVPTNLAKVAYFHISTSCKIFSGGKCVSGESFERIWYNRVPA